MQESIIFAINILLLNHGCDQLTFLRVLLLILYLVLAIMAGNWKMNPATEDDAVELGSALTTLLGDETCAIDADNEMCVEVVVFPPFPFISKVKDCVEDGTLPNKKRMSDLE